MAVIAPSGLGIGTVTPTGFIASWDNGEVYDEIQFRYAPGATLTLTGTDTSKELSTLSENTSYTVDVRGKVGASWSDWCTAVVQLTPLLAPTGLAATNIVDGKTTLSWTNNTANQSHLKLQYSNDGVLYVDLPDIPGYPTSVEVSAAGGGDWYFKVRAFNTYTTNYSEYTSPLLAGYPLPAPTGLLATPLSSTTARADWTDASTGETGFKIETSLDGITYAQIDTVGSGVQTYTLTGLTPGVKVWVRVRAYDGTGDGYYSNVATVTPAGVAVPTNIECSATKNSITVRWVDNSNNEDGFKIYLDGSLNHTTGPNETEYTITGLSAETWYKLEIEAYNSTDSSGLSDDVRVFTSDPPAAPTEAEAVVVSSSSIRANWKDNAGNETGYSVEKSTDGINYAEHAEVGANITTLLITGLSSNTQYWIRVRALNDSGYSGYSNVANAVTFAAIAMPTNLTLRLMRIAGTFYIEGRFDDNSSEEDGHEVYKKVDGGSYSLLGTLAANKYFFYDSDVEDDHTYYYYVRAKQDSSYSSNSAAASIGTFFSSTPAITLDTTQRYPDKLSMSMVGSQYAVGYEIQRSPDDATWAKIADIPYEALKYYTATGLTAGTLYYFRLKVTEWDGTVSYSASVSTTTPTEYAMTEFEKLCLRPKQPIIYLIEANPYLRVKGWALTATMTYTYEHTVEYPEIEFEDIYENGVRLTETTTVANVEATAGTWYHDYHGGKVYVHPSGDDSPSSYTYLGSTWLYFTNWQRGQATFNDHLYLPLVPADGLPTITQRLEKYWKGSFVFTHGSVSFINGRSPAWGDCHYFDKRGSEFIWLNRRVKILAGGEDFDYADFDTLAVGIVTNTETSDRRFTVSLKDPRSGLHRSLPLRKYSTLDFPNLYAGSTTEDEGSGDIVRPFYFGACTHVVPVCIDTVNKIFELMDAQSIGSEGRITSVEAVTLNGTALVLDTDYYVDYGMGRILLDEDVAYTENDSLLVSFTGAAWRDGTAVDMGPWIFFYCLYNFMGLSLAYNTDINMESIFTSAAVCTEELAVKIYKETTTVDLIEVLEKSCLGYSFQDALGRIGFRVDSTTVPSEVAYLSEQRIIEVGRNDSIDDVFAEIHVHYDEWPSTQRHRWIKKEATSFSWMYGVLKRLDIYTAHATESNALALGDDILAVLNKPSFPFTTTRIFMPRQVGDMFYLTRTRFFDDQGTANARLMRITEISKDPGSMTVGVVAEEVS